MAKGQFGQVQKQRSGRFQARYIHPEQPYKSNGARNYITAPTTFRTKTAANVWLAGVQADIERGVWKSPEQIEAETIEEQARARRDALTFGDYADSWMASRNLTPSTYKAYESNLRTHLKPRWEHVPLKAITTTDIRAWLSTLAPNAPGARKKAAELFRTILNTAVDDDLLIHSPYKRNMLATTKAPTPTREVQARETQALEYAQLEALANEVPEYMRTLVLLSGYCGLRSGEARELRGKDIHVTHDDEIALVEVHISRAVTGQGKDLTVGAPKTIESIRAVPVPDAIAANIVAHAQAAGRNGLLFHPVNDHTRHIPERTYQINIRRAAERLNLGHVAPHDFRRTMATEWIALGVPLSDVQAALGHTTPSMTMRYTKSTRERLNRAVQALNTDIDNRHNQTPVASLDERRAANQ